MTNEQATTSFETDIQRSRSNDINYKTLVIINKVFGKKIQNVEQTHLSGNSKGPDVTMKWIDGQVKTVEIKARFKGIPNELCLEPFTDITTNRPGWTTHIESDYIIFLWPGKIRDCYIIVDGKGLQTWYNTNHEKYQLRKNKPSQNKEGYTWQSAIIFVPLKDLPRDIIISSELQVDLKDYLKW